MDCSPAGSSVRRTFPDRNTRVGCHFLLQGIFPTRSNPPLLLWQVDSLPLSHQRGPRTREVQAKSRPPPDFVNKVLSECSHSHSFLYLWGCFFTPVAELTVVMETMWPAEAKIFTNCFFTENVCDPSSLRKRVWLQVHSAGDWLYEDLLDGPLHLCVLGLFHNEKLKKKKNVEPVISLLILYSLGMKALINKDICIRMFTKRV